MEGDNKGQQSAEARPVAPTITIDTTPSAPENAAQNQTNSSMAEPSASASPSSPETKRGGPTLLSVPGGDNAIETDDGSRASSSYGGETLAPASTAAASKKGDKGDNSNLMNDGDALTPDPGQEANFKVDNNVFAFSPGQLSKQYSPKSLSAFHSLGGLDGLERGLRTNCKSGLSSEETKLDGVVTFDEAVHGNGKGGNAKELGRTVTASSTGSERQGEQGDLYVDRKRVYGANRLPEKKIKSFWELAWIALKDKVLILLSIAAIVSLALGLYTSLRPLEPGEEHEGARVDWVEGVAIMAAVAIVVLVGAANDWQKERQFAKLNRKKEDRTVKVIRSGKTQEISVYDIVVGDVMTLEPGDLIPVDGIFIQGYGVKCDESSATGESDIMPKTAGDHVFQAIENHESLKKMDPFILSGGKVSEGVGTFLVTAVGVHSSFGKTLMSLQDESEATPLQIKLNNLAEQIAKLGGAAALLLFVVLFIKFLAQLRGSDDTPAQKGQNFLNIVITTITVVVVAVPEGLPLAVTLALAVATTRMLKDNNLVRVLRACETMGNATTICSDKTGTLTTNKMTVVAGTVGTAIRFDTRGGDGKSKADAAVAIDDVTVHEFINTLSSETKELLKSSIVLNSTAFEGEDAGQKAFIGSKTETALLNFAKDHLGLTNLRVDRANATLAQVFPFDSGRKCMACVEKLSNGKYRLHVKGASEILLDRCTYIIDDPSKGVQPTTMSSANHEAVTHIINTYASKSLRTIGIVFRDYESWPPKGVPLMEGTNDAVELDGVFKDMTFLGVVGIQDPLRDGVKEAVAQCATAGVFVRMVTGDNMTTAKAIAEECGIFTKGGLVLEGPTFRRMTRQQMDAAIPKLQVLARSSPEDKRVLVKRLKEMGETVAVTGDGTNDGPALKMADVGFSMGIAGTEVAKEASAIILMDDNFSSIVKALMWGRAVNDSVQKFLQFQLTVNITAVLLTFVSAVSSSEESSVLTAVQLLWVNLIMDTFAALALATDPPTPNILHRKPDRKSAPLITVKMWKMIIGQAIYQLVVTFILYFGGRRILSYDTLHEQQQLKTLVFNTFVWMQIFNQYNNRRLDDGWNIFEGVTRNWFFIGINLLMIGGQVLIVFVGGAAFAVTRLNGAQWGYSIVLGALSVPVAIMVRCIPDSLVAPLIPRWGRKRTPEVVISDEEAHRYEWNQALVEIREDLSFLKRVRGGRLNALKFKITHPRELLPRSRDGSSPATPDREASIRSEGSRDPSSPNERRRRRSRSNSAFGPAAAMAGVVAGSIAGWSPIDRSAHDGMHRFGDRLEPPSSGAEAKDDGKAAAPVPPELNEKVFADSKPQDQGHVNEKE